MNSSVLIIGGAGYIGSHIVKMLMQEGINVKVFDNLSRGYQDAVLTDDLIQGDLLNPNDLVKLFQNKILSRNIIVSLPLPV